MIFSLFGTDSLIPRLPPCTKNLKERWGGDVSHTRPIRLYHIGKQASVLAALCLENSLTNKVNGGNFRHAGNFGHSIGNDVQYDVASVLAF